MKLCVMTNNAVSTFEWLRGASGWTELMAQALVRTMPVSCSFDNCMYGICDGNNDNKLQKPFRVVSTSERLQIPLSLCCDKSHQHSVTRGEAAISS
eukprot:3475355-Heterocapsa_arctica.AAC.1